MNVRSMSPDVGVRRLGANWGSSPGVVPISSLGDLSGYGIPQQTVEFLSHAGFQIILLSLETDESQTIHSLNAVIDIYYVGDVNSGDDTLKIGRISYWGKLVPGPSATSRPTWSVSFAHSLNYDRSNASELPDELQEVGPGGFVTAVIQTLLGTRHGQRLCGLQDYKLPDCR